MKEDVRKKAVRRLRIISGQVKGLERMVSEDKYCVDIIYQSLAAKEALSSFEDLILENHLGTHVAEQFRTGEKRKATKEILMIHKLSRQK
ncbi:MAG: metal-sensitive transcriptional regulator [Candidatus Colwellbacteria bacterium]|nr:metal-sensitive transcriptional regulator [Candidatus Colwellbacteria bacterium]